MSTWESVDFPEPFGPITAWTSPEATSRSTPRSTSWPSTAACNPSTFSMLTVARSRNGHDHVVALDPHRVHRDRARGGQGQGLAGGERELGPVLRALHRPVLLPHVTLREGVVGMR